MFGTVGADLLFQEVGSWKDSLDVGRSGGEGLSKDVGWCGS